MSIKTINLILAVVAMTGLSIAFVVDNDAGRSSRNLKSLVPSFSNIHNVGAYGDY